MAVIRVPTSFNIDLEFEMAEFHRRMFAWLIDVILQILYIVIAIQILRASLTASDFFDDSTNLKLLLLLLPLPIFFYHPICEIFLKGQSIGKMILGIRVVSEDGGRPSISQFIIRAIIRAGDWAIVSVMFLNVAIFFNKELRIFLLGSFLLLIADIILVAASRKSQRLGDILAHTILVNTRARGKMEESVFIEVADNYIPVFPQIMNLSDSDINAVKNILDTARKKNDFNLAAIATEKIKNHLKIETSMSPFDFLETVMKDYNYLSVK
jgi:uncharacterized RDD family membrane protein YckC